jgi:hypothetical protein
VYSWNRITIRAAKRLRLDKSAEMGFHRGYAADHESRDTLYDPEDKVLEA